MSESTSKMITCEICNIEKHSKFTKAEAKQCNLCRSRFSHWCRLEVESGELRVIRFKKKHTDLPIQEFFKITPGLQSFEISDKLSVFSRAIDNSKQNYELRSDAQMKKLDKATFVIKQTLEENRTVTETETEFKNLKKKKKKRRKKKKEETEEEQEERGEEKKEEKEEDILNSNKSITENWIYFDELSKKFYFSNVESELTFQSYCEKYNLRWNPVIHTDPNRASAYHEYDLEITERNHIKVDNKTIFQLEDTMQSLRQCSISNGPDRPWFRIVKDYFDKNNNLIGAEDLRRTKTDKRLIPESDFFWLPENVNMLIKDYFIEWEFFEDPARENWKQMDILPIAEHFYNPTDSIQQSKSNDKLPLIDPTHRTISELNCKTVIIGRKLRACGSYRCDNPECGSNFRSGIKGWHSFKSYKGYTQGCSVCKAPTLPEKRSMTSCWEPNFARKEKKGKNKQGHMQNECEMCQCKNRDCQLECVCSGPKSKCKCPKIFCKCEERPPSCSAPKGEKIKVFRDRNRKGKKVKK